MNTIGQFFRMIAEALGIVAKRQELKNAADVKAAAKAQQERESADEAARIVDERNADEIRKKLSDI